VTTLRGKNAEIVVIRAFQASFPNALAEGLGVEGFEQRDDVRKSFLVVAVATVAQLVEGVGGGPVLEDDAVGSHDGTCAITAVPAVHQHRLGGGPDLAECGDEVVHREFVGFHALEEQA